MHTALEEVEGVLLAIPTQYLREVARQSSSYLSASVPIVLCCKGIEQISGALPSEVLAEILPRNPTAVLSGPTFASEVARGLPTAVTVAAVSRELAAAIATTIGSARFRPYAADDPLGVQVGGALKNVVAIACGIVQGRGLGENARAALLARGLAEMTRLGVAKGGRAQTLMGLSGLGDLALTCTSQQSRNATLGVALGRGESLDAVVRARRSVAEGVATAPAAIALAARLGVEIPISESVNAILHHGASIDATIEKLLQRPLRDEQ
jgi:glycerol-3-phosphate dehydrogenase (NAD(P)+)